MKTFSQRLGIEPEKELQYRRMYKELRNSLWSCIYISYITTAIARNIGSSISSHTTIRYDKQWSKFRLELWLNHFKYPVDELPDDWFQIIDIIHNAFFSSDFNKAYELIEFFGNHFPNSERNKKFKVAVNKMLERENAPYRFVGDFIAELTDKNEIAEIEDALKEAPNAVKEHLTQALKKLSDRDNPDYRNSIKESISAVESLCKLIASDKRATLGKALKKIQSSGTVKLHPSLRNAFDHLYGYTSDEEGIRHSLLEESNVESEDARFMLVSCSAFINYLTVKANKASIDLKT